MIYMIARSTPFASHTYACKKPLRAVHTRPPTGSQKATAPHTLKTKCRQDCAKDHAAALQRLLTIAESSTVLEAILGGKERVEGQETLRKLLGPITKPFKGQ